MTSSINPIDALWGGIELSKQEKSTDVRRDHINHLLHDFHVAAEGHTKIIPIDTWKVNSIFDSLDDLQVSSDEIELFALDLLKLDLTPEVTNISPTTIEFICDLDAPDINGSMMERLARGITEKIPIVTTRSLLHGTGFFKENDFPKKLVESMATLGENYRCYSDGPFLVLVPKELSKEQLDLADTLQEIPVSELFKITGEKPSLEQFCSLFSEKPKNKKFIYIAGHGNGGNMAGMNLEHYSSFLKWAKLQRCEGLLVTSCFGGGKNSLLHLGKEDLNAPPRFGKATESAVPFPVFIRSVGDYSTIGGQVAESGVGTLFARLSQLLNSNQGGRTTRQLKKLWEEIEDNKDKASVNMIQAYLPSAADSPTGFRTLGEGGRSLTLTFTRYRQLQTEHGRITTSGCSYVNLSPLVIEVPLVFEESDPLLLSLVPGDAVHVLSEVHLATMDPIDFLNKQIAFSKSADLSAHKIFYFGSLRHGAVELKNVYFDAATGRCLYKEGDRFYLQQLSSDQPPKEISSFQYHLRVMTGLKNNSSGEAASRTATGGQQNRDTILNSVDFSNYSDFFKLEQLTLEELQKWNLSQDDLIQLIPVVNEQLAINIMEAYHLSPDLLDIDGNPLILTAALDNKNQLLQWLLDHGADVNAENPRNQNTALHAALLYNNTEPANLMLEHKNVKIDTSTKEGYLTLSCALDQPALFEKILKKFPEIDLNVGIDIYGEGYNMTLLNLAIEHGHLESVRILLAHGADPKPDSYGVFYPLKQAIISGNQEIISLLLSKGASIYHSSNLIELAVLQCPLPILKQMMGTETPQNLNPKLVTSFREAAIGSGDEEKINLVLGQFSATNRSYSPLPDIGITRLCIAGKWDLIRDIITHEKDMSISLQYTAVDWVLKHKPLVLIELINSKEWDFDTIPLKIARDKTLSLELQKQLLSHLMEIAGTPDLAGDSVWSSPLATAIQENNKPLARFLAEKGMNCKKMLTDIALFGDFELAQLAFKEENEIPEFVFKKALETDLSNPENRAIVRLLIKKGADVKPHLHKLIEAGYLDLYQAMIEREGEPKQLAELAALTLRGKGPDKVQIFQELRKLGATLNEPVKPMASLFTAVIRYGSPELIDACLAEGASLDVEAKEPHLMKPLEAAAHRKDEKGRALFKELVDKGANIDETNSMSALIQAGDLELIRYCFDHGATCKHESFAVKEAYESGKPEIVEELGKRGLNLKIDFWLNEDARQLVQNAFKNGGLPALSFVLDRLLPNEKVENAIFSIMNDILKTDNLEALKLLQDKGIPVDGNWLLTRDNFYSFTQSSGYGIQVRKHLLREINESERQETLQDALIEFIAYREYEMIELAIELGVSLESSYGPSPIFLAVAQYEDPKMVSILLKGKPSLTVNIPGHPPLSVIEVARQMGLNEIVSILEKQPKQ